MIILEAITLEAILEDPKRGPPGNTPVRIWSGEHQAWWGPDGRSYFTEKGSAGIYSMSEAWRHTKHCCPKKKIQFEIVPSQEPKMSTEPDNKKKPDDSADMTNRQLDATVGALVGIAEALTSLAKTAHRGSGDTQAIALAMAPLDGKSVAEAIVVAGKEIGGSLESVAQALQAIAKSNQSIKAKLDTVVVKLDTIAGNQGNPG